MADKRAPQQPKNPEWTWTSTANSGWCSMGLHGWEDSLQRIEHGYCRLGSTQCGCPCHRGERVSRRRAWTPAQDITDPDDEQDPEP